MRTYTSKELSSPANAALVDEITLLIAHSFTEDPGHKWLMSNHSRKSYIACLPAYIRLLVRLSIRCDALFTVITKDEIPSSSPETSAKPSTNEPQLQLRHDATIRAIGITIPPHGNATMDSLTAAMLSGGLTLPFRSGFMLCYKLIFKWMPALEEMHDKLFPGPTKHHNWHLFYLATHPDNRGQGLGKRILLDIQDAVRTYNAAQAEKAKVNGEAFVIAPLYLESSSVDSKRLYNRVGFEDRGTFIYGNLDEGENLRIGEDGSVIGGRQFGMVWTPRL